MSWLSHAAFEALNTAGYLVFDRLFLYTAAKDFVSLLTIYDYDHPQSNSNLF